MHTIVSTLLFIDFEVVCIEKLWQKNKHCFNYLFFIFYWSKQKNSKKNFFSFVFLKNSIANDELMITFTISKPSCFRCGMLFKSFFFQKKMAFSFFFLCRELKWFALFLLFFKKLECFCCSFQLAQIICSRIYFGSTKTNKFKCLFFFTQKFRGKKSSHTKKRF